jgi:YD repeat-containing protein
MPRNFAGLQMTDMRRYSDSVISAAALEVHSRYAYDGAGKISSITHAKSEIAAGQAWNGTSTLPASITPAQTIAAYHLSYDRDNRLTAFASYTDRFRTAYSYDTTDQLIAATSTTIVGLAAPSPAIPTKATTLTSTVTGGRPAGFRNRPAGRTTVCKPTARSTTRTTTKGTR